jgi:hypothetical protein
MLTRPHVRHLVLLLRSPRPPLTHPSARQKISAATSGPPVNHSITARAFSMSAPAEANLHKDEVTGEMVSKS